MKNEGPVHASRRRRLVLAALVAAGLLAAVSVALWQLRGKRGPPGTRPLYDAALNPEMPLELVGKWHVARNPQGGSALSAAQKQEMARLESLSYLAGYNPAPARQGVTVYVRQEAYNGYNLAFSGHGPEAVLMDMEGRVLHRWRTTYEVARRRFPALRAASPRVAWSWRRGHLYPNGDLLAIFEGHALIKVDKDSRVIWALPRAAHHDLFVDRRGHIFVLTRRARVVTRINKTRPVLLDYVTELSADGKVLSNLSLLECFEDSPFRYALTPMSDHGDIFHTNTIEVLDGAHAARDAIFKAGNLLISVLYLDQVAVVDPVARKVVWARSDGWVRQHEPQLLPNGNMLLFDNQGASGRSRVLEFYPITGDVEWEYRGTHGAPFDSAECGTAYRLPNGNTLITESLNGRAFEVNRAKRIVWEYYSPHRAGESNELIATLFDMVRLGPDFPLGWIPGGGKGAAR